MVRETLLGGTTHARDASALYAESAVRAYKVAMTEPRGPVLIVLDATLQERANPDRSKLSIPKLSLDSPPVGDPNAIAEAAQSCWLQRMIR